MRKVATILLIVQVVFTSSAAACVCADMNEELAKAMFEDADFVIYGRAVSATDPDPNYEKILNNRNAGSDIIFEVDSVLKGGTVKGEKIFIYQDAGSCIGTYKVGGSYLILGKRIKKLKKVNYNSELKSDVGFLPPSTSTNLKNGILEIDADDEYSTIFKYLDNKLKRHKTITTNMCASFSSKSRGSIEFLAYLKK